MNPFPTSKSILSRGVPILPLINSKNTTTPILLSIRMGKLAKLLCGNSIKGELSEDL